MEDVFINWSGGKDASFSLYRMLQDPRYRVRALFTTVSEPFLRVSMHGVREQLLHSQVERVGIPLQKAYLPEQADLETYDRIMEARLEILREEGMTGAVFGDIFLEDLRRYRERQLDKAGFRALFPLWKENTRDLAEAFIVAGFRAVVCCVDGSLLGIDFAGRDFDLDFLRCLPPGVDPCGENGEFHTFVYDGPIFSSSVPFRRGETVERTYPVAGADDKRWSTRFFFCDLLPGNP